MKNFKKTAIKAIMFISCTTAMMFVFYAPIAFYQLKLNPTEWTDMARFMYCTVFIFSTGLSASFTITDID